MTFTGRPFMDRILIWIKGHLLPPPTLLYEQNIKLNSRTVTSLWSSLWAQYSLLFDDTEFIFDTLNINLNFRKWRISGYLYGHNLNFWTVICLCPSFVFELLIWINAHSLISKHLFWREYHFKLYSGLSDNFCFVQNIKFNFNKMISQWNFQWSDFFLP